MMKNTAFKAPSFTKASDVSLNSAKSHGGRASGSTASKGAPDGRGKPSRASGGGRGAMHDSDDDDEEGYIDDTQEFEEMEVGGSDEQGDSDDMDEDDDDDAEDRYRQGTGRNGRTASKAGKNGRLSTSRSHMEVDQATAEPAIPPKLLTRMLHDGFEDGRVRIGMQAREVVGMYMETFVREALARAAAERSATKTGGGIGDDFLQVVTTTP